MEHENPNKTDSATGIKVIPPVVYVIGFLLGYGAERLWPILDFRSFWTDVVSVLLILISALMALLSVLSFRIKSTPFDVRKPATSLVTTGPYRISRNPGYVALSLLYIAIGMLTGSIWVLIMLVAILFVMHYAVVLKEEQHLEAQFGEDFLNYKARVRRWL